MNFLVVVRPPVIPPSLNQQSTYGARDGITARWVEAPNARAAADKCEVLPGGKAHVIASVDVETFSRAEKAPLESDRPLAVADGEAA